jgi:hypothetical protein
MAKQTINIGTSANDGTGDPLRTAFDKINDNFTELYDASPATSQITLEGNEINTNVSNANLVLNGNGTGGVLASSLLFKGTTISSDDSTQVQINENLDVDGNITASGNITATGNVFAKGNINLGDAAGDQTKVVGVFEADQIQIDGTTMTSTVTNGSITLQGNGTGGVNVADVTINDNEITASNSNSDLVLNGSGTGSVKASGIKVSGTTITSDDSSTISINEALDVDGTLNVAGATTVAAITASGVATFNGTAVVDNVTINDSTISTSSNADLNLTPGGTGSVVAGGVAIKGTTISAPDSSTININEGLVVDGSANVSGTLTTADITTVGNHTISSNSTVDGTLTVKGSVNADTFISNSNGDITIDPAGTGAIVLTGPITATGTQTTTGQLNVDNLRMDGNTLSATSGGMTIDAAAGQNITFNKKIAAGEIDVTLIQATTARVDALQNDTSNGDISISTQGTGVVDFNTATQTTVGSAGGANALPGTPTGYLEVKIGGTARVIPFYDKS